MVREQLADTPFVEKEEAREVGLHWASPCTSNALGTVSNHCRGQDTLNPGGKEVKKTAKDVGQPKRKRETEHTPQKPKKAPKKGVNPKGTCKIHVEGLKTCQTHLRHEKTRENTFHRMGKAQNRPKEVKNPKTQ